MFLLADGTLLLNEIAPRPHNSGHYTIEACATSQYEQHLRAILGWPLGDTSLVVGARYSNNCFCLFATRAKTKPRAKKQATQNSWNEGSGTDAAQPDPKHVFRSLPLSTGHPYRQILLHSFLWFSCFFFGFSCALARRLLAP